MTFEWTGGMSVKVTEGDFNAWKKGDLERGEGQRTEAKGAAVVATGNVDKSSQSQQQIRGN